MAVDVLVTIAPAGRFPVSVRIKVSLLGSTADTETWAVVLTVTFITDGPVMTGGKFSVQKQMDTVQNCFNSGHH